MMTGGHMTGRLDHRSRPYWKRDQKPLKGP
jgi:hypothetical protein